MSNTVVGAAQLVAQRKQQRDEPGGSAAVAGQSVQPGLGTEPYAVGTVTQPDGAKETAQARSRTPRWASTTARPSPTSGPSASWRSRSYGSASSARPWLSRMDDADGAVGLGYPCRVGGGADDEGGEVPSGRVLDDGDGDGGEGGGGDRVRDRFTFTAPIFGRIRRPLPVMLQRALEMNRVDCRLVG
ncbi:hypothetical protein [Streptomyces sp. SID12501]|uniref:Uncharacterized protein n=1 Tax=Streptomyces sp. SID12501 TaxID=2706042 RepID=A0A6B3C7Q7_9ACTN|nr:hypothetical protein [Streptomyces sp. SID12501]NEC92382.1 hypothetical protein [Streptomyces sp. SID12501]